MLHSSTPRSFVHRAFERFLDRTIMRRAFRASQGIECHSSAMLIHRAAASVDRRAVSARPTDQADAAGQRSQSLTGERKLKPDYGAV
jgi:hypothetical protein